MRGRILREAKVSNNTRPEIEKILHLRQELEKIRNENHPAFRAYESAKTALYKVIDEGEKLCLEIKAQYLLTLQNLSREIQQTQTEYEKSIRLIREKLDRLR